MRKKLTGRKQGVFIKLKIKKFGNLLQCLMKLCKHFLMELQKLRYCIKFVIHGHLCTLVSYAI